MRSFIAKLKSMMTKKGETDVNSNETDAGIEKSANGIPEHEIAEAIACLKADLRTRREELSDRIMKAYADGRPLHQIRLLEERLGEMDRAIGTFKD